MGVPCDRKETVPARLVLNPAIVLDQQVLKIVAETLQNEPRLDGVTIVMMQEAEFYHAVAEDNRPLKPAACSYHGNYAVQARTGNR